MRTVVKPACARLTLLLSAACAAEEIERPSVEAGTVAEHRSGRELPDAGAAVSWNELAYRIAVGEDQFLTFKGHRTFSMLHLAMHDALNTIVPLYERYGYFGERMPGDPEAAAAQAAYEVLLSQYPDKKAELDAELAVWLDAVPEGGRKTRGIALGKASAAAILRRREGDRWDFQGSYEFKDGPGQYRTTPPWDGFVAQPGFRYAKPFALRAPERLRPPPPPPLWSKAYGTVFNEVKSYGAMNSKRRTQDQTGYAVWWMEFAEGSVNRLARQLVIDRRTDLWRATRLFAHLNMALYDGYIVVWDSKYKYNHWRPSTATREAAHDGNAGTKPDRDWLPMRDTPPFPEYVSAHAAGCAGSLGVLKETWGDRVRLSMTTTTAPPGMPARSFRSFTAAAQECADSRVMLGWHFRYATDAGLRVGRSVAEYVMEHHLRRRASH